VSVVGEAVTGTVQRTFLPPCFLPPPPSYKTKIAPSRIQGFPRTVCGGKSFSQFAPINPLIYSLALTKRNVNYRNSFAICPTFFWVRRAPKTDLESIRLTHFPSALKSTFSFFYLNWRILSFLSRPKFEKSLPPVLCLPLPAGGGGGSNVGF